MFDCRRVAQLRAWVTVPWGPLSECRRLVLAFALAAVMLTAGAGSAAAATKRVVGYFPSWAIYNPLHPARIANLPPGKLNVLNYAFGNVSVDGSGGNSGIKACTAVSLQPGTDIGSNQLCPALSLLDPWADVEDPLAGQSWNSCPPQANTVCGNFADIKTFEAANPSAKVMLSIGGWTLSDNFTVVASTAISRQNFANSLSAFLKGPGSVFDGIDIDWEYPVSGNPLNCCASPQDRQNFTALLQTIKQTLTQNNPGDNLVSIAAPAGAATLANLDLGAVAQTVDWINLMAYDFNGPFPPYAGSLTNFNAPLHYDPAGPASQSKEVGDAAVQAYLNAGVPASKINLGLAFYGRGYSGVTNAGNGLYQAFTGPGAGSGAPQPQVGLYPYWSLEQSYINHNGYTVFRDAAAGNVPYVFNPNSTAPESGSVMISYDDPASLTAKVQYANQTGLGGVMVWDLSEDDSNFSLLNAVASAANPLLTGIGGPTKKTVLRATRCGKVNGVPVFSSGPSCHTAAGVYRAYVHTGKVSGWHCSSEGQICWQHKRAGRPWAVSWWSRLLERPSPQR
jgi:chitinase